MKNLLIFTFFACTLFIGLPKTYAAFPVNTATEEMATPANIHGNGAIVAHNSEMNAPAPVAPAPAMGGGGPGLSIAALVLGIVAVLTSMWTIAIIAGALAIIFGALNLGGPKPGMALAGLILGIIGVALALII